jgi:hypothetical protein
MAKYMLCGYCPMKVRLDPSGPVIPSHRGDVRYEEHAMQHEKLGPFIDDSFVTMPKGEYRPPRPLPVHERGSSEASDMWQGLGWD